MVAATALALALLAALAAGALGLWVARRRLAALRHRLQEAEARAAQWAQALDACAGSTWLWLTAAGTVRAAGGERPAGTDHLPAFATWLGAVAGDGPAHLADRLASMADTGEAVWFGPFTGSDGRRRYLTARNLPRPADGRLIWAVDGEAATRQAETAQRDCATAQAMLAHLPVAVWARNEQADLLAANAEFGRLVASDADEAVEGGREILTTRPGESSRTVAEKALAAGTTVTVERHVVVAGERRLLSLTETPVAHAGAGPVRLVGHGLDITRSAELAAERDRHIAAHNDVLEQLATAIAIYGPDKRLLFFNSAYARLWELEADWLSQEPSFADVLETQRARGRLPEQADFTAFRRKREALFTDLLGPHEELLHLPDMTTLRMTVTPHPFGGLLFTFEDVTDKFALESAFNTLLATQRESLDNLVEGIAVAGPDGGLRLTNSAFGELLGLGRRASLANHHYYAVLARARPILSPPETADHLGEALLASVSERTTTEGRLTRTDGRTLDYATVPLPDGAGMVRLLDVTDTVRIQTALREREAALAEAERLKAELIANISYHLRSPLNALMGYTQMLEAGYGGALSADQKAYVATMTEAGRRLTRLIETVLDIAAVDAGRLPLRRAPVKPRAILAEGLNNQRRRLVAAGLALDTTGARRDLPAIYGDRRRLVQVIAELVSNAINFTPAGGTVSLACTRVDASDGGQAQIALIVRDNGIGIPAQGPDVFARFERAHPAHEDAGPGLGLPRARALTDLHDGRIAIDSAEGVGTALTVYLPVAEPAEKASGDAPTKANPREAATP